MNNERVCPLNRPVCISREIVISPPHYLLTCLITLPYPSVVSSRDFAFAFFFLPVSLCERAISIAPILLYKGRDLLIMQVTRIVGYLVMIFVLWSKRPRCMKMSFFHKRNYRPRSLWCSFFSEESIV